MFASIPQKGLWFLGGGLWQNQIYSKYKALRRANWASSGIARLAASSNSSELKQQITAHYPGATHPDRRRPSRTRELVPRALARQGSPGQLAGGEWNDRRPQPRSGSGLVILASSYSPIGKSTI